MQAIIFDMDDTLVIEETIVADAFLETCRLAKTGYGIPPGELHPTVQTTARELWRQAPVRQYCLDIGLSSWEGLHGNFEGDSPELGILRDWTPDYRFNAWNNALMKFGVDDKDLAARMAESFIENLRGRYVLFDDAVPCLEELSRFYPLALLSNGAPDIQQRKINCTGIAGYFKEIIISGELGYGKPDPRIYNLMLSRLGTSPESTWMVGNSLKSDIHGANNTGLKTAWLNRKGAERDESIIPDVESADLKQLTEIIKTSA